MTIVTGVLDSKGLYMGADSLGSNGFTGQAYKNKKVFKKKDFIIGGCGSYRMLNLLKEEFNIPVPKVGQEDAEYIYKDFNKSIIKLFDDNGFLKNESGIKEIKNSSFIFAYNKKLYEFQHDLSIIEPEANYVTCGSGCYHAEASLFSTEGTKLTGEERIKRAIICANNFVVSVNDKIQIETIEF